MTITHIVSHIGGGVKSVLLDWLYEDKTNKHIICCLNYTSDQDIKKCNDYKIELYDYCSNKYNLITDNINKSDVVILHYWNFPLMLKFLIEYTFPDCRLIVWNHISGLFAPNVLLKKLYDISDRFVFTSKISYKSKMIKSLSKQELSKVDCIRSTAKIDKYRIVEFKEHTGFNILYIGTLDFSKMSCEYVDYCYEIYKQFPDSTFTVCGSGTNECDLKTRVKVLGLEEVFTFTGLVSDIRPYIERADIFLYLLNKQHFGTGEQILGETLASGLIPIVFNNNAESEIVFNDYNGFVIKDKQELVEKIKLIRNSAEIRRIISNRAKKIANELYDFEYMKKQWKDTFKSVMPIEKTKKKFDCSNSEGYSCFIESLDSQVEAFNRCLYSDKIESIKKLFNSSYIWKSKSKGTVYQYLQFFPEDAYLNLWSNL